MTTSPLRGRDLPRSEERHHPPRYLLTSPLRPLTRALLRRRFDLRVHHADRVPADGPVIVAGNHIGILDGPLMAIAGPRPVHALTKNEMFHGRTGTFLRHSGQIPVDRFHVDPAAVRACLAVLRAGHVVGVFPEGTRGAGTLDRFHRGAAYLALVTGAPVVPLFFFGTRLPGGHTDSVAPKGARVDLWYGEPLGFPRQPWPRTREQVDGAAGLLREHMLAELDRALAETGLSLPGPLPANQKEPDPATGITDPDVPADEHLDGHRTKESND